MKIVILYQCFSHRLSIVDVLLLISMLYSSFANLSLSNNDSVIFYNSWCLRKLSIFKIFHLFLFSRIKRRLITYDSMFFTTEKLRTNSVWVYVYLLVLNVYVKYKIYIIGIVFIIITKIILSNFCLITSVSNSLL